MKKDGKDDKELPQKLAELEDKYLRSLADYQNLEKQTQNWKAEFVRHANSELIRKLLEIVDDLETAQEHLAAEGLKLILEKFKNILRGEGLQELDLEGKEYNPSEAEVVSTEPGEKEHIIVNVLQKGYKLYGKVIRPAKVIVSQNG